MEIKTKYNIGDKLWTIHAFRVVEFEVAGITIEPRGILYRATDYIYFEQENCFATKEELITYLTREDGNENV